MGLLTFEVILNLGDTMLESAPTGPIWASVMLSMLRGQCLVQRD